MRKVLLCLSLIVAALFLFGCTEKELTEDEVFEGSEAVAGQAVQIQAVQTAVGNSDLSCTNSKVSGTCTKTKTGLMFRGTSYPNSKCTPDGSMIYYDCNGKQLQKCRETCKKACTQEGCIVVPEENCYDSDGGEDIYTKGTMRATENTLSGTDNCEIITTEVVGNSTYYSRLPVESCSGSDCNVNEYFIRYISESIPCRGFIGFHFCENGCYNGACYREPVESITG